MDIGFILGFLLRRLPLFKSCCPSHDMKFTLINLGVTLLAMSAEAAKLKSVVYYMEWAIYQRNFGIYDLDWSRITHVNYAFGRPKTDGTVDLYDTWAATDKRFIDHGDSWNDQGKNVYGTFGQGNKMKKKFRNTKFGLSIGGWTLSDKFSDIASTEYGRRTFARSAVNLMLDLGLDFIDLDWEYPVEGGNPQPPVPHRPNDIVNYVSLLQAIRDEFKSLSFKAELSVASQLAQTTTVTGILNRFVGSWITLMSCRTTWLAAGASTPTTTPICTRIQVTLLVSNTASTMLFRITFKVAAHQRKSFSEFHCTVDRLKILMACTRSLVYHQTKARGLQAMVTVLACGTTRLCHSQVLKNSLTKSSVQPTATILIPEHSYLTSRQRVSQ